MRQSILMVSAMVAIAAMSGAASAADLPARVYTKAAAAPVMTYNWSGCYVGGSVGGGWARTEQTRIGLVNGVVIPAQDYGSATGSQFIGGGQVGCDYRFGGNWVVGLQGMFEFGRIESGHIIPPFPNFAFSDRARNMFTATARVGYLFAPQVLAYVKGGGAFTRTESLVFGSVPVNFLSESALGSDRTGWAVGGGLEWMFAPGWSVFGEYDYMDFGRRNIGYVPGPQTVPGTVGDILSTHLTAQTALVGVNYRFNFATPVVAGY